MNVELQNDNYRFVVNSLGAEINEFKDLHQDRDIIWTGDASLWKFHAPVLFPHCGKIKDGYTLIGEQKQSCPLVSNGFARDLEFNLIKKTENSVRFLLEQNEYTLKRFPYHFSLQIDYTLKENGVNFLATVTNTDTKVFSFSFGSHSAFCINSKDSYLIEFQNKEPMEQFSCLNNGLLACDSSGTPFLSPYSFEKKGIIPVTHNGFGCGLLLKNNNSDWVKLHNLNTKKQIQVSSKDFPYVVLWQNAGAPHFLCIEPWQGLPDLENSQHLWQTKMGLINLEPKQSKTFDQSITIF